MQTNGASIFVDDEFRCSLSQDDMAAHGSDLFRIRRIFSLAGSDSSDDDASASDDSSRDAKPPLLKIEAMAVHTLEKKQLLAMSVAEDLGQLSAPAAPAPASAAAAATAHAHAAASAPAIALGRLPSIEPRKSRIAPPAVVGSTANAAEKQRAALLSASNYVLVRTIEEDQRARFWKFPVRTNSKQQSAGKSEKLVALEFSPEGDWLAGLSSRKNRLHLIPVLKLIAKQRKQLLDATYAPPHNRELMSVHASVMNTQMASYLRATNEAGGLNGARYHSQVAGDDEQMSTLEFAAGIGTVTCCRWWRSMNSKNYCLVGGTENLISVVNVEENAEECRCELQNAGTIVSIDLFRENFRKETRTTMLVKARGDDQVVRYYRVVLEKKFQVQQKQPNRQQQQQKQSSLKSLLTPMTKDDNSASTSEALHAEQSATAAGSTSSSFASSSGAQSFTTSSVPSFVTQSSLSGRSLPPQYVVKTFPQHFLEDMDFRPQRIKKNSPQICLYAINGMLTSESSLALYDPNAQRASLFSNFQWTLRNEYVVPSLAPTASRLDAAAEEGKQAKQDDEAVVDVEVSYCTTDLLLLQGRTERTKQNVSTWISLPSHNGQDDEQVANAHIVHYLSLHGNEKIERVVQSTSRSSSLSGQVGMSSSSSGSSMGDPPGEAQVIYILQTQHHVYECRPQWSRLALFKTLCAQSITLRNALSIGYALGIDMASLCQIVAETLCENIHKDRSKSSAAADDRTLQWVRDLFQVSRALASTAIEQLTSIGGARYAIDFAQQLLDAKQSVVMETSLFIDAYEKKKVALLLLDLVLREQLRANVSSPLDSDEQSLRPRDVDIQARLEDKERWVLHFLETSRHFDTEDIVDLCLSHQQVDKAVLVGKCRNQVHLVLQKIISAGLASFVSVKALRSLVASGFASELTAAANRLVLRAFPLDTQVDVLLAHVPAILQQRDWLLRNLPAISAELCRRVAKRIDPQAADDQHQTQQSGTSAVPSEFADVASSEAMPASPEERVELFLTILLRLNRDASDADDNSDDEYSQAKLETLMKELARQYRPPVMVARCVDYGNWTAAASLYEAHGELVEAVEARLHSHKVLRPISLPLSPTSSTASSPPVSSSSASSLTFSTLRRRRQSSDASVDSNAGGSVTSALSDTSEFQDAMREELFQLLNSLVVQRRNEKTITEEMKAAILARLLVKWFEYGLPKTELEVFLIDPKVYPFVSSLLAKIFFSEVVEGILGGANGGGSDAAPGSGASGTAATAAGTGGAFDDRDKEWVRKCHHLPFSGQFLFHVCASFLDSASENEGGIETTGHPQNGGTPSGFSRERRSVTLKLLDLVKENVVKNDLAIPVVTIEPHSAQALGKSDPLETHVKVFSCGHVFPKRVFDEEIVPEFEKRLSSLPLPLFTTKQVLLREFKSSAVEAPCPICAFNKISALVLQQRQAQLKSRAVGSSSTGVAALPVASRPKTTAAVKAASAHQPELYFLHAATQGKPRGFSYNSGSGFNGQQQQQSQQSQWRHEVWEWRAIP